MDKDFNKIDKLVNSKMQTHAVDSTVNSWAVISRKMAWRNFLYFRLSSINIYYVSLFLIASIWGTLSYSNATTTSSSAGSFAVTETIRDIHSQEINPSNTINIEETFTNPEKSNPETQFTSNTIASNETQLIKAANNTDNNYNTEQINATVNNTKLLNKKASSSAAKNDLNELTHKNAIIEGETQISSNINISQKVTDLSPKTLASELSSLNQDFAIKTTNVDNLIQESFSTTKYSELDFMSPIFLENMMLFSDNEMDPDFKRDDTLEFYKLPSERTSWLIEAYFSPLYTSNVTKSIDSEMAEFINTKSEIESPVLSFTTGLNIMYQGKKNILLQTGVAYTQLGERIKREDMEQITTSTIPIYPDGGYDHYDTITFINLDSLNQGIHYTDTMLEHSWIVDNSTHDVSDTAKYKGTNTRNKYTYIEIPVIGGYNFEGPGFDLQLKAGLITGFWLNSEGMKANPHNSMELVDMNSDSPEYRKVNYAFTAGFNVNYPISDRFNLTTGLMYRKSLFDIHDSYLYDQRQKGTELHLGIQYRL